MSNPTPDTGTLPGTALETYGKLLNGDAGRDAIHLAVYAVTTDERLFPGQHVGIASFGDDGIKVSASAEALIGIVDPFLDGSIYPGQWFWLTLYPRTITSLRHEWTHPAFDVTVKATPALVDPKVASEAWLREWIRTADCPDYETVMAAITGNPLPDLEGRNEDVYFRWEDYGDGPALYFNGRDAHSEIPDVFWDHVEVVTGTKWAPDQRGKYFSCSC